MLIVKKPFRPTGTGSEVAAVGDPFTPHSPAQERLYRALKWIGDAPVEITKKPDPAATVAKGTARRKESAASVTPPAPPPAVVEPPAVETPAVETPPEPTPEPVAVETPPPAVEAVAETVVTPEPPAPAPAPRRLFGTRRTDTTTES